MSIDSDIRLIPPLGHSAKIEAHLHVGQYKLRIGRVGSSSLELREVQEIPPRTEATVVVCVDGLEQRMPVLLIDGISRDRSLVEFV